MAKTIFKATSGKKISAEKKSSATKAKVFRQRGVSSRRAKAELKHVPWNTVELEALNPLIGRQFVVGRDIMIARVLMKKGAIVPEHSHVNEQVTYILEGALKFWIDGREIVVKAGEVLAIPPNMPHKAEALIDTVDLDVFNPPRADWMNKDDSYLRGSK
ncbi:MAG: hypothetical protein NVS1B11_09520 [Terriglobales bacterium]